jgi:hypothetical protein
MRWFSWLDVVGRVCPPLFGRAALSFRWGKAGLGGCRLHDAIVTIA